MIKVALCGAGKMGGEVAQAILADSELELVAVIDQDAKKASRFGAPAFSPEQLQEAIRNADVCVDFTMAEAAANNVPKMAAAGKNVVVGTTGFSPEQRGTIENAVAEAGVAGIIAPNFSVGASVFCKIAGEMAKKLQGYDVEIIEAHHNEKKDAPSGTALKALAAVAEAVGAGEQDFTFGRGKGKFPRRKGEIGVHAIRGGNIVGEHTILFAGNNEKIELCHSAQSRACFAAGCVRSIKWIASRKDGKVHSMEKVLGF